MFGLLKCWGKDEVGENGDGDGDGIVYEKDEEVFRKIVNMRSKATNMPHLPHPQLTQPGGGAVYHCWI